MAKKVVIISSSLRKNSNSEALAQAFQRGAAEAGNDVSLISLRGKQIAFCQGCLACQKTGKCVIGDDANAIEQEVLQADVVVLATPIYYYEMSGQLKTLLDRMNSMYPKDYKFRSVYALTAAAEDEPHVPERAVSGITGWIDCYEKAKLAGSVFAGGVTDAGSIAGHAALQQAYEIGKCV